MADPIIPFAEMPKIPEEVFLYLRAFEEFIERASGGMMTCPYINQHGVVCGQPLGHKTGHGNGLLTTPRDEWKLPAPPSPVKTEVELQKEWALREGDEQCLWQGPHARCILRLGHFPTVGHVEASNGPTNKTP